MARGCRTVTTTSAPTATACSVIYKKYTGAPACRQFVNYAHGRNQLHPAVTTPPMKSTAPSGVEGLSHRKVFEQECPDAMTGHSWAWAGSVEADAVPFWMIVGPRELGAAHGAVVYLVRMRQSASRGEWAFRPLSEIHQDGLAWRGLDEEATLAVLARLETAAVVQRSGDKWRATRLAEEAVEEAYAQNHPLLPE